MPLSRLLRAIGRMVFILLLAPSAGFCQNSPFKIEGIYKKNLVSAPDMAAMTKNIVYPVNHSTGTVEIKIPLYEVKSGTLTLPIYLTYNTGGVKLQDSSGWVGQGWSLFATPAISRMAQGHIDSHHTCNFSQDYMSGDPYSAYEHILSVMDNNVYSVLDEQPDEYYYKLPEKSGMFMYSLEPKNSGTTYLPIPYEDVKITYAGGYFTIVDDNGTTYRFEGGKDWSSYPANYESGWRSKSGEYLNLGLLMKTGRIDDEDLPHSIGLAQDTVYTYDNGRSAAYYRLLHSQNGIPEYYTNRRYVSILLPQQCPDTIHFSMQTYEGVTERIFITR